MRTELTDRVNLLEIGQEVASTYQIPFLTEDSNCHDNSQNSVIAYTLEDGVEILTFLKHTASGFDSASLQFDPKAVSQFKLTYTHIAPDKKGPAKGDSVQAAFPTPNRELARKLAYGTAEFILSEQ